VGSKEIKWGQVFKYENVRTNSLTIFFKLVVNISRPDPASIEKEV
jgi:hypothetical protein